jgi:hypothetical protein
VVDLSGSPAARRLPQPAYRLDDGTDMVAADFLALVREAGSIEGPPGWFAHEYVESSAIADDPHS